MCSVCAARLPHPALGTGFVFLQGILANDLQGRQCMEHDEAKCEKQSSGSTQHMTATMKANYQTCQQPSQVAKRITVVGQCVLYLEKVKQKS